MRYAAFLRAINVAGHNKVPMTALKSLCEQLGLRDVQSVLQSGNIVFTAEARDSQQLETLLETESEKRLKLRTGYFVRDHDSLQCIIKANPFPSEAQDDPSHLLVMFLKQAVSAKDVDRLRAAIKGPEQAAGTGRDLYITYPAGIGRSKLTNAVIERALGTSVTGRNWNTLLKITSLTAT
jgi:uncharacterized protein (DUF1697 family)